jgi:hypothetical protein
MKGHPGKPVDKRPGRTASLISFASFHWKWWLSALCIFSMAIYLTISSMSFAKSGPLKVRRIEPIPLTADNLCEWAKVAEILIEQREQGKIRIPAQNLPELIEWGRHNLQILEDALMMTDPLAFLGVSASIQRSRMNFRKLAEHELRLDESYRLVDEKNDLADRVHFNPPAPPKLESGEQADLSAYELHELLVERSLDELFPGLPPLVPAWEEIMVTGDGDEKIADEGITHTQRVAWRIISRSRYGPRVLRAR